MKLKRLLGGLLALSLLPFTSNVLAANLQFLRGHVPAVVTSLASLGELPATNRLSLAISLPLRNELELSNLLNQIYDPHSPKYRHYLTVAEFTEQFGPSAQDYESVIGFAKANGLKVTATYANRGIVDVSGTASQIERTLHTQLNVYRHPTENRNFYAPTIEPSLNLSVPVLHISGLDNYELPRPRIVTHRLANLSNASPNSGSGPSGTYKGNDFRAAYVPGVTLNGTGQSVGLLEFDGYSASDINYYESSAGLPNVPLDPVSVDGASTGPEGSGADLEVALDIEVAISMATNLTQLVVYIAPGGAPFEDILNKMVMNTQVKQFSCSWYISGGAAQSAADNIWMEMAAQGQSFFNASGDSDALAGLISFPGDSPYITQVGGTTLTTTGPGGAWSSETVWNWGNGIGSSGGISTQYPIPSWQTNISMAANQGSTTMRNTPDVAMTADNIYVRVDGADDDVGGTSCAAPLWAGFAALINQQAVASGRTPIGLINAAVDAIGTGPGYTSAFHDITTGNNTRSGSPTQFYAVTGYDLCMGWGTPAGQQLINDLANPEPLVIAPSSGFVSTGGHGGPFTTTSQTLTLTNYGTNTLTWTLSNTSAWLNVSSTGGTLTPGGPVDSVTVSLNSAASNLVVGVYNATLWFTNLYDGFGQSREFTLNVIAPPTINPEPTNEAVLGGATAVFNVEATGGLPLAYQWQLNGTNLSDGGNISGSLTTNLVITDVSSNNVGTYTVVVTNLAAVTVSSNALLTIIPSEPVIVTQPTNETVVVGQAAFFGVTAYGNMPLYYQWSFNGTNIVGATNANYILSYVQLTNAGIYSVFVTNTLGSVSSSNALLTVLPTPPCDAPPSGIVSWWPGEGNANDIIGTNNGVLEGSITFGPGEVGQAFLFPNTNSDVRIPASASINVGAGSGFTVEAWINPSDVSQQIHPIFEWNDGNGDFGVHYYITQDSGPGTFYANIVDSNGQWHQIHSPVAPLITNVFQHVALTYDQASGLATMYYNGAMILQQDVGSFTPFTTYNLYLGRRLPGAAGAYTFAGLIDEPALYNRALGSNEIAAIYNAGGGGKCPPVPTPPFFSVQPTNQTVAVGGTANFSVVAGGTAPLSYQWYMNETNRIIGATNTSLTLTNVQTTNTGTYDVVVSNPYSSIISSNATLIVFGLPPSIITQPANALTYVGQTVSFNVLAGGTTPLSYQWRSANTNIIGATNTTLTLTNVQFNQAGSYSVLITNLYGSTNSASVTLTVNPLSACDPTASGIVSWWPGQGNANDIIGTNNGVLEGSIAFGPGEVGEAFLFTNTSADVMIPASASLNVGAGSGFTVEAWINPSDVSQTLHPIFEWNDANGDFGVHYYISQDNGPGTFYANIVNSDGDWNQMLSPVAPLVTNVFQHVALTYDQASGLATMYYNGAIIAQQNFGSFTPFTVYNLYLGRRPPGAAGTFSFAGLIDEPALYNRALGSNEIAAIYNAGPAGKCAPELPYIVQQPTNTLVRNGGTANFSVAAGGTAPFSYQWYMNSTNQIIGATNISLTITNVQLTNAGSYEVSVANIYGLVLSSNALLTVAMAPTIASGPTNLTVSAASSATFSVTATGSPPLSFQWNFNNTNAIFGATNSTLILTNVQYANGGLYSVIVTNLYGSTTSSNALLIVTVDHFAWSNILSPKFAGAPFTIEIVAQNATNGVFTNYTGIVFISTTNGVAVSPAASGNFVQGIWTGTVAVSRTATNLVLSASDGSGHIGLANPISVVSLPPITASPSAGTLYLSWPTNPAGFQMESTTNLSSGIWVPIMMHPLQFGDQYVEPITPTGTNTSVFYRLYFNGQ